MSETKLYTGDVWHLPEKLKTNLDILLTDVKNSKMDLVIVFDGYEGTGKSFGARGIGRYCATFLNTTCNVADIEFSTQEYITNSMNGSKFKINILDEARNSLGRGKTRTPEVQKFLDYISECRFKQQVHIICLPAYHDLSKYIVLWRMAFLIHFKKEHIADLTSESQLKLKRGAFKMYTDKDSLNYCYENPYNYPKVWEAWDRWSSKETFGEEEIIKYEEKKEYYMRKKYLEQKGEELSTRQQAKYRRELIPKIASLGINNNQIAEIFNVHPSQISRDTKTSKEDT